jgi:hypothetical protein
LSSHGNNLRREGGWSNILWKFVSPSVQQLFTVWLSSSPTTQVLNRNSLPVAAEAEELAIIPSNCHQILGDNFTSACSPVRKLHDTQTACETRIYRYLLLNPQALKSALTLTAHIQLGASRSTARLGSLALFVKIFGNFRTAHKVVDKC